MLCTLPTRYVEQLPSCSSRASLPERAVRRFRRILAPSSANHALVRVEKGKLLHAALVSAQPFTAIHAMPQESV